MERADGHMRPGPRQSLVHGKHYEKLSEFANISGQLYEIKMAALIFLRAVQTTHNFHLATNMKAAGSFDDVMLSHEDETVFLQLKHRKNFSRIRTSQLIQLGGDFSLLKYCSSYFQVKQEWGLNVDLKLCNRLENSMFVVYTDAKMVEGVGNEVGSTQLYNVINSGGKCIQFTEDSDREIFNVFNNLNRYKQLLIEATTGEDITNSPELLDAVQKLHNNNAKTIPTKKELTKLLKDLNFLGDLSGFREFLSHLRFCTEQAPEKHLDPLIKHELKVVCGTVSVFEKFVAEVQNWWRNSREFLTLKIEFWQDIVQLCIVNLSELILNQILNIGIKFSTEEIDRIRALMLSSGRILHVISNFSILSTSKFQQSLGIRLLVDGSTLLTHLNEVVAAWVLGEWNEMLLVTGGLENQDIVTRLIEILKKMPGKRLVLMTRKSEKVALKFSQAFEFGTYIDTFSLKQLDVEYKEKVLASEVEFQGFIVPLKSLAEESTLEKILTSDVIIQLLSKNKISIGEKFNEVEKCYIERKFLRKEIIDSKDLFDAKASCLAISGISHEGLKEMLSPGEYVIEFEKDKDIEIKAEIIYVVIKDAEDFNILSERYEEIHWFHYCGESFMWRKSKSYLNKVRKFIDSKADCVEYNGVEEMNALPNKFVLITAEPGMGKSTELSHVALQMKQNSPNTCVVVVNLSDHTDYLAQDKPSAIELLLRAGNLKTTFEEALFRHYLDKGCNTIVMIDSFDEISPVFSEVAYKILGELSDMNIKTVWVASRPVMKEYLEEKLCTLSFCLKSFTECEQKEYLLKFWKPPTYCVNNIETFVQELLELISECLNDRLKAFTGIPLQTKMLAEVFECEFRHYCDTGKVLLPHKLNLLQLYHRFIETKWRVFYEKYNLNVGNVALHKTYQNLRAKLEQGHMICGLVSLLSDKELQEIHCLETINKKCDKFFRMFLEGDERTGVIVNITNGKAVFVHRTFMEYFVAMWLYNNWKHNSHLIRSLYLNHNFQIVRHFFDRFLTGKCELHVAVMNRDKALVDFLLSQKEVNINDTDEGGRTALHLAVMNFIDDYYDMKLNSVVEYILTVLLDNGADCDKVDNIINLQPIGLAEEIKAWYAVGLLLQKGAETTEQVENDEHIRKVLELLQGRFLVEFMLRNEIDVEWKLTAGINYDIQKDCPCDGFLMVQLNAANNHLFVNSFYPKDKADISDLPNDISYGEFTPAEIDRMKAIQCLIVEENDVNDESACKNKALRIIIDCKHYHTMKFLIEHKADVKIHGSAVIHSVACSGNIDVDSYAFDAGLFIDTRNRHLETLVLTAARNKN